MDGNYDLYGQVLAPADPRRLFRTHPECVLRVLTQRDAQGRPDIPVQSRALSLVYELLTLRRAEGVVIEDGNDALVVKTSLPPFHIFTIHMPVSPLNQAEFQLASIVYTTEFLDQLKRSAKSKEEGNGPSSKE